MTRARPVWLLVPVVCLGSVSLSATPRTYEVGFHLIQVSRVRGSLWGGPQVRAGRLPYKTSPASPT